MMETLVPRLRSGVRVQLREDASAVLVDEAAGRYTEIAADQARLLAFVDGKRTAAEIAAEHYQAHRFVPFQALGDLLARLAAEDGWDNPTDELRSAGVAFEPARRSWRLWSIRLLRLPIPAGRTVALGLLGATAVLIAWGDVQTLNGPLPSFAGRHPLLGPQESPLWGLLLALSGVGLAMGLRSVLRGGLAAAWGAPLRAVEIRLHFGIPTLELESGPVQVLSRGRRIACHAAAAVAPLLLAGWALLRAPWEVGPALALGAAVCGFMDLCPFAPTSLGQLLSAVAGRVDLRDHARSYLSRKFLSRVGTQHLFEGEGVIVITSALSTLWCVEALDLVARQVPRASLELIAAAGGHRGLERISAWVYLALLLGGTLGALWLTLRIALSSLASALPQRFRRRAAKGTALQASSQSATTGLEALRKIALFAELPAAALEDLAKNVSLLKYPPRSVVVRQGDYGDHFYAVLDGTLAVLREDQTGLERQVAQLGLGDCFGEVALLQHAPRTATVQTLTSATVLGVGREAFERMVRSLPGLDVTRLIRAAIALHKNPLLNRVPPERLASLLAKLVPISAEAGQRVVQRGDTGDAFYLVDDGELEVLDERETHPIAQLKSGDHFGEIALLRNVPRIATVRAVRKSSLWSLSKADFFETLGHDLTVSGKLEEQARFRARHQR